MFLQTYRFGVGREVDEMNAQVGKDLNVDRNELVTQMSIQDTAEEEKASSHNLTRLGGFARKKNNSTQVDCSGVGTPSYKKVRGEGIAGWVISGGIQVLGIWGLGFRKQGILVQYPSFAVTTQP